MESGIVSMYTLSAVRNIFLYRHSSWSEEYFYMDTFSGMQSFYRDTLSRVRIVFCIDNLSGVRKSFYTDTFSGVRNRLLYGYS